MTTANKITIVRLLLIPVFVLLGVYYGNSVFIGEPQEGLRLAAILVFLIASVSDGLDGYIARRYHQRTKLGAILDPIADKGLLLAALLTLTFSDWGYHFPLWFPVLVIGRDFVIVAGSFGLHYVNGDVHVSPRWTGKVATVFQMAAIAWVMLQFRFINPLVLVTLAGLFTFVSGVAYVTDGIRQLQLAERSLAGPPPARTSAVGADARQPDQP
jgi:cardiolipin synthase